jgi:hypothetical protein
MSLPGAAAFTAVVSDRRIQIVGAAIYGCLGPLGVERPSLHAEIRREQSSDHGWQMLAIDDPAGDAVEAERQCCRFLRFAIVVEPDGGPIALQLSGPTGTRAFLSGLIEA